MEKLILGLFPLQQLTAQTYAVIDVIKAFKDQSIAFFNWLGYFGGSVYRIFHAHSWSGSAVFVCPFPDVSAVGRLSVLTAEARNFLHPFPCFLDQGCV